MPVRVLLIACVVLLSACKIEYPCSDENLLEVAAPSCTSNISGEVVVESQARLTDLQLSGEMTLSNTAIVTVSCDNCPGPIQYRWLIDGNVVSTSNSHLFTQSDLGKSVQVEVRLTDSDGVLSQPQSATFQSIVVEEIITNDFAFAAIKTDGSVVTWGVAANGGDSTAVSSELTNVDTIIPGSGVFAAIKKDGTVVTWGLSTHGGDSSAVSAQLVNVTDVTASGFAYAARKSDGSVVTWGDATRGGDSSAEQAQLTNVAEISGNGFAFTARKADGSLVTWGDPLRGGDLEGQTPTNITKVIGSTNAFMAIDNTGATYYWGNDASGGTPVVVVPDYSSSNVQSAVTNDLAFAMLKTDGTVTSHGNNSYGGDMATLAARITNATSLHSSKYGFAALISDGSVVSWGQIDGVSYGVSGNTAFLEPTVINATAVTVSRDAFAVRESAGTVVVYGDATHGGDSSAVAADLVNVDYVVAARSAFSAKKSDGSVVAWGDATRGGDTTLNLSSTLENVQTIVSSLYAFAAISSDKKIITWGLLSHADISAVASELEPKIIQISNTYN